MRTLSCVLSISSTHDIVRAFEIQRIMWKQWEFDDMSNNCIYLDFLTNG